MATALQGAESESPPIANRLQLYGKQNPAVVRRGGKLLHQQHLARALDGTGKAPLVVRGQSRVLAGKNAPLVSHELPEEIRVLEIQRVDCEIDLRFGPLKPLLGLRAPAAPSFLFLIGFTRHSLLDFLVDRVPPQKRIVLLDFKPLGLELLVLVGRVAGRRFAFLARLGAFEGNDFAWHNA